VLVFKTALIYHELTIEGTHTVGCECCKSFQSMCARDVVISCMSPAIHSLLWLGRFQHGHGAEGYIQTLPTSESRHSTDALSHAAREIIHRYNNIDICTLSHLAMLPKSCYIIRLLFGRVALDLPRLLLRPLELGSVRGLIFAGLPAIHRVLWSGIKDE
jgi:hypothetical protein